MIKDDELKQIFISEAREILENINRQVEKLRVNPLEKDSWSVILRELHTLKGSARMLDLLDLNIYAHQLEEIIQKFHHQTCFPTNSEMNELQHVIDYMNFYIDALSTANTLPKNETLFVKLNSTLSSNTKKSLECPLKESAPEELLAKEEQDFSSLGTTRIRSDLLEKFNDLSAQINITRTHVEQKLKIAHNFLLEMATKIQFTHEQMRLLQVKTDSHLKGYQKNTQSKHPEFDILEMDKYTLIQEITQSIEEKLAQLTGLNSGVINSLRNAQDSLIDQKRIIKNLEKGLTRTKLISIENLIPRLQRVVRQVSNELGKKVKLECSKVEGQIDKNILEKLVPSLEHMLRNAIDHGIEMPAVRKKTGKSEWGMITLSSFRQGNEILIQLSDDGEGIDINKIKEKAIKKQLWVPNVPMALQEAIQIMTQPGFSTKDSITPISGQGVGLDVVNTAVTKLGGNLRIESTYLVGTQFTIRLPFTLSLNQALIFMASNQTYALQLSNLVGLKQITKEELHKISQKKGEIFYGKNRYQLFPLLQVLGEKIKEEAYALSIIFLSIDNARVGLLVDKLIGCSEIVIKPPGAQLQFMKHIAGLTVLGDGKIAFILDASALIASALKNSHLEISHEQGCPTKTDPLERVVLIVDDSMTVRHIMSRLLKRNGFITLLAKNAKEALMQIQEKAPDIILLDIEMPEMDGYQLLEEIRASKEYQHIPIIMITSRTEKKHQQKALLLGANAYLTKPYLDEELLMLLKRFK